MIIKLTIGDWSDDGHGKTSTVVIEPSLNAKEIEKAFRDGVKIVGQNITKYCDEYEETAIPLKALKKISQFISHEHITAILAEETYETVYIEEELYTHIYLETAKLGNKDFDYKIIELPEITIGGYGFFH